MLSLMKSHNMVGLVDGNVEGRAASNEIKDQYNSFYGQTTSPQQDAVRAETMIDIEANDNNTQNNSKSFKKVDREKLYKAAVKGIWYEAEAIIKNNEKVVREAIDKNGSTILHIAVGIGHNDFVKRLLPYMKDEDILEGRSSDGSTALHIAAIVGNTYAVDLLVEKTQALLQSKDHEEKQPLHKAYENMHLDTIGNLFKRHDFDPRHGVDIGVELLVNAISAKKYILAFKLMEQFPKLVVENDGVLMALAKTKFPSGLDHGERFIYPSLKAIWENICQVSIGLLQAIFYIPWTLILCLLGKWAIRLLGKWAAEDPRDPPDEVLKMVLIIPLALIVEPIYLVIFVVSYIFLILYFLCWKAASMIVAPFTDIQMKKEEGKTAERVLQFVCDIIDRSGTTHSYYKGPILEAARQNSHKVIDEILFRSPEAIQCKDNSGYDIIQLAILHRSDKIYNLIYEIGERKNLYRTVVDSSKNNILHLAGKLAPSHELSRRTGAALQLQRELQWREEVKKLLCPTYITQENNFKETPNMLFTREHAHLLKEGEQWMKTTAESCSITAGLITTIVFAAAITVPGGTREDSGTPFLRHNAAFTIFAISDAISLFTSSTAVLVFLSILTARFAEKDFLVSLPRRLFIGLCALFISTTAMMVAFSAALFLVLCHEKTWMLGPICGLALIPILSFVTLQFPLILDLFRSTFLSIFGKKSKHAYRRFDPNNIRLLFDKWK